MHGLGRVSIWGLQVKQDSGPAVYPTIRERQLHGMTAGTRQALCRWCRRLKVVSGLRSLAETENLLNGQFSKLGSLLGYVL